MSKRFSRREWALLVEQTVVWTLLLAFAFGLLAALLAAVIPAGPPCWHAGLVAAGIGAAVALFIGLLVALDGL